MEVELVYQKLKQYFPHELENIDYTQLKLGSSASLESMIGRKLPMIPFNQLHTLCRNQEKNVMDKVLEIKQMDLYEEMHLFCPNKDLKNMRSFTYEEVNIKIQQYTSEMNVLQEKQIEEETYRTDSDIMDIEDDLEIDEDIQNEIHLDHKRGLGNIFEDYDHHLPWNELGIYDLH